MIRSVPGLAVLALLAASPATAQTATIPTVTVDYLPMFDAACAEATGRRLEADAAAQLIAFLPTLRESWAKEERELLGAVVAVTGVPFRFGEALAALFLCRGFPSMSLPLMINARSYVPAASDGAVAPLVDFTNVLFHEVLHRYVRDRLAELPGGSTPLLQKYGDEPPAVRNHLHLYAIEQLVYETLGRQQDLAAAMSYEQKYPRARAIAARAREIVAAETADAFIRELGCSAC